MTAPGFRYNGAASIWVSGSACDGVSITYCVLVTGEKCVLGGGGFMEGIKSWNTLSTHKKHL